MAEGKLFYVIGPSGSGKDSLLRYGREHLAGDHGIVFAHRYITRPVELQGENHVALTEAEFDARLEANLFAMHWQSHGLRYGIGQEINLWLNQGCHVVINGSREYLPKARHRYPTLTPILVSVSIDVLAARLRARGRETQDQVSHRVARAAQFVRPEGPLVILQNDAALPIAGERLMQLLSSAASVGAELV